MPSDKLSEYLVYRNRIKQLLLIVGIWPNEQPSLWYRSLPFTQLILSLSAVLTIIGYVRVHFTNVARVTKGVSLMSSFLSSILKTTCVITNRKAANKLHETLDSHFIKLLNNPQLSSIVLDGVTSFRRLSWMLSFLIYLSCFAYVTTPIILIIYQQLYHIRPIKYLLVIPAVYPWTIHPNGLLYKCHYIFESIALITIIVVTCGIDLLFTLYVFQMIGQFREMSYRIIHIDENNDYRSAIRQCTIQHGILMECRDILDKIYGPIILWTMIINAISLCSQMFEVKQMITISIGRAIFFSGYVIFKLMQTFVYAWAGSCLTKESESYKVAVYASNWHTNKHFMTSVLIMLAQKPLILTACKFSVVSVDIFVMVLNTSISYFFLLQTLHENN